MSCRGTPYCDMALDAGARGEEAEQMAAAIETERRTHEEARMAEKTRIAAEEFAAEQMAEDGTAMTAPEPRQEPAGREAVERAVDRIVCRPRRGGATAVKRSAVEERDHLLAVLRPLWPAPAPLSTALEVERLRAALETAECYVVELTAYAIQRPKRRYCRACNALLPSEGWAREECEDHKPDCPFAALATSPAASLESLRELVAAAREWHNLPADADEAAAVVVTQRLLLAVEPALGAFPELAPEPSPRGTQHPTSRRIQGGSARMQAMRGIGLAALRHWFAFRLDLTRRMAVAALAACRKVREEQECFREYVEQWKF